MLIRIHQPFTSQEVVGICDKELLGQTLKEGDLTVTINDSFFGGDEASEERILDTLRTSGNIILFGEKCVGLAIRNGLVDQDTCCSIAGVPHATIVRL